MVEGLRSFELGEQTLESEHVVNKRVCDHEFTDVQQERRQRKAGLDSSREATHPDFYGNCANFYHQFVFWHHTVD